MTYGFPNFICHLCIMQRSPFQNRFVTKYKLTQILHHTGTLSSEILNCLGDQIRGVVINPFLVVVVMLSTVVIRGSFRPLLFEHVQYTVDCAKGACSTTSGAAVNHNRPKTWWLGVFSAELDCTAPPGDFVALFNKFQ
jgi:hypothetical protein